MHPVFRPQDEERAHRLDVRMPRLSFGRGLNALAFGFSMMATGCFSGRGSMPHTGPAWSIASAAAAILAELDSDGNRTIDRAELVASDRTAWPPR